jgi:hypothetical protein
MPLPLPEKFRAAIGKGVRDIAGELRKLNAGEKRLLLADLRERGDCPEKWKNKDSKNILKNLHIAIYRLLNPEKVKAANARNNKRRIENGKAQEYAKKIKENGQVKAYNVRYKADPINKDTRNARHRERYATDLKFRTMHMLRSRLYYALKNNKKDHTMDLLGCTMEQMLVHLEKQFTPGMTWDNQGKADDEWEIDHIIPFVAFDVSNRDEQFIVSWYQNLQPLWGPDNRIKGGKYTEEGKQSLICKYNEHKK